MMTRNVLYIIHGPCGSGKSSTIRAFRTVASDVAFVDFDFVKDSTFRLGDWDQWRKTESELGEPWRRDLARSVGLHWIKELALRKRPIVTELCDTLDMELDIRALAAAFKYTIYNFLLLPSLETCIIQNRTRAGHVPFEDAKVARSHEFYSRQVYKGTLYTAIFANPSELIHKLTEISPTRR